MLDPARLLTRVLAERARETPERVYLEEAGGAGVTYAETQRLVERWASAYRRAGVRAGDTVLVMLPFSIPAMCSWLGLAWLGAIEVPVNTAYRGRLLRHVIDDSQASLLVVAGRFLPQLAEVASELEGLKTVIVVDAAGEPPSLPFTVLAAEDALAEADEGGLEDLPGPSGRDTSCILYTSGTTGPPKGVEMTWAQLHATAVGMPSFAGLSVTDAWYSPFPAFHIGGKHPPYQMALAGGRLVLKDPFKTQDFWPDIRRHGCTHTFLLSAMTGFVLSQPPQEDDADNPLRHVIMVPLVPQLDTFRRRFDVEVSTLFTMTEISVPIRSDGTRLVDGRSCGRLREGYEARVVDDNDEEVARGEMGELVVRAHEPWLQMSGYWRAPAQTVESWRNHWFHTGDAFTCDPDGNFYFVERNKDVIRRRGENISSSEIESEAESHPEVAECAAVGVPSKWGEQEVKLVVVPGERGGPAPEALFAYLSERLPAFMVPRYIELVGELPMTPTQKVKKAELRAAGVTATTWDGRPDRR